MRGGYNRRNYISTKHRIVSLVFAVERIYAYYCHTWCFPHEYFANNWKYICSNHIICVYRLGAERNSSTKFYSLLASYAMYLSVDKKPPSQSRVLANNHKFLIDNLENSINMIEIELLFKILKLVNFAYKNPHRRCYICVSLLIRKISFTSFNNQVAASSIKSPKCYAYNNCVSTRWSTKISSQSSFFCCCCKLIELLCSA